LALKDFEKAMTLDPTWIWPINGRGLVLHDLGRYHEAIALFDASLRLNPDQAPAHEYKANALFKLGRKEEALNEITEAIRKNSNSMRLYNRRAMYYYYNREFTKAIRDHTEALKREPNDAATYNYLGWVWSTAPDPNVRNGRRALECATRACELTEWQSPGFIDTLAAAHAELGQFNEAIRWEEKAIHLAKDEKSRALYADRAELYRNKKPLRVDPDPEAD
jgi:serine/threonine-protein kinase